MKQRQERMAQIVRKVVAEKLRELATSTYLTVTEVDVAPDLKHATVWISNIGPITGDVELAEVLADFKAELQQALADYLQTKYTPRLHYKYDSGSPEGSRIQKLLDDLHVNKDEVA